MLTNYLKVFIRLFYRQTVFTLINILGLGVSLACCLVIALFVRHELSFDRFHTNADALYRIGTVVEAPGGRRLDGSGTFFPVASLLEENLPVITDVARLVPKPSLISVGDESFYENEFRLVDPGFFRLFDLVWLEGDPATALAGATDVVLTKSYAKKFFGNNNPLGQSLLLSEGVVLRVTAVIEDLPGNTHISGTIFASMALRDLLEPVETRTGEWLSAAYYTYAVLRPDVDIEALRNELDTLGRANLPSGNTIFTLKLEAVTDIHLNTPSGGDMKPPGSNLTIAVFMAVGIGILLVACANFVNLSTVRSVQRFGEVGLRLTLGARRAQLIGQFLGESVLFVLLALVIALALVELLLPGIQAMLGLDLAFDSLTDPMSLFVLLGGGLALGLVAGWYPAFLMSSFKPAMALRNPLASRVRGMALKNVLVVLQFTMAIGMIVASTVIYLQMQFTNALELGYARDQVVVVNTNELGSLGRISLLKERLLQGEGIASAAVSEATPDRSGRSTFVSIEGDQEQHRMSYFWIDFDYFSLYEIPLMAGRLFREDMTTDMISPRRNDLEQAGGRYVINERAARELGWSAEEAVGKRIFENHMEGGVWFSVVGVVADTIHSAHTLATPAIYAVPENLSPGGRLLSLRLEGHDVASTLSFIDRTWKEVNPGEPIVRTFLHDNIEARYQAERRLMQLSFVFAAMAILISCMGLFGLASFNTERRTKEIGVRKVMGGSVWSIVLLLTNDFSKLVLISNLIAWPIAYIAMNRWLENFAYRIDLAPMIFIVSGLIVLCLAWVTVGGTAAKAASAKPVLAMRYE